MAPVARRASDAAAVALASLLLLLVLAAPPRAEACFRSLRRPPYETYWLGTYHDSRLISLTCFAMRGFRWTLKLVKVTYENWHTEMQYARCISESYGMNIPFISPPWSKNARMLVDEDGSDSSKLPLASILSESTAGDDARREMKLGYNIQQWEGKDDMNKIITSLQPVLLRNSEISQDNFPLSNETESMKEALRIVKSLYQIFVSVLNEIGLLVSRTFGSGVLSCTRKYMRNAFWRWVDSSPFLK